jgi:hypothetical protein
MNFRLLIRFTISSENDTRCSYDEDVQGVISLSSPGEIGPVLR